MKTFHLWIITSLLLLPYLSYSQEFVVRGTVVDSAGIGIPGITTSLQALANSDVAVGAITDRQGKFIIELSEAGAYRFMAFSPGFMSFVDTLNLTFQKDGYELGKIPLGIREFTADEVSIEAEQPGMIILGDTVVYNVAGIQTRPNAVLEKLLEQLPGIEVNDDGSVTAEGQPVQQIKIDGREFFGNNVKLAVKNIPVEAVDKIQVTDSKTEESTFTRIDDGVQLKTLNIKLKPASRRGYFGNLAAGYGVPDDRYVGKANAFRFSPKMQLSVLGLVNNVNEVGFGGDQIREFMGGWDNMGYSDWDRDGVSLGGAAVGIPTEWGDDDGFINTQAGGFNLNYQPSKRSHITATYIYGGSSTTREELSFRRTFLPDRSFTTEDEDLRNTRDDGHAFNFLLRQELDSTQQLRIQAAGSWSEGREDNASLSRSLTQEGLLQNSSTRDVGEKAEEGVLNIGLRYNKRFKKQGRNMHLGFQGSLGNEKRDSDFHSDLEVLNSETGLYDRELLLQEQLFDFQEQFYRIYSGFTEPLDEKNFLTFGLSRYVESNDNIRDAFDLEEGATVNRIRNQQLSNHFERSFERNRMSVGYRLDTEHFRIRSGINLEDTRLKSDYLSEDTSLNQPFFFILPNIDLRYTFDNELRIDLEYETSIDEPSMQQLQPFVDNSNPFRLYQGNPGLIPEYTHEFDFDVRHYDREARKGMGISLDLDLYRDPIATRRTVDEQLRQISSPLNVDRGMSSYARIWYEHPFKWLKSSVSFSLQGNYRENELFINDVLTDVEHQYLSFSMRARNRDRQVIAYYLRASWYMNQSLYTGNTSLDRQSFTHRYQANLDYHVNQRLTLASDFSYRLYTGDAFAETQDLPIWSAEILYYPFKESQLELKLSGTDLLNRNQGFQRRVSSTYIEEKRVTSLARYFLFTATWKLSALGVSEGRKKYQG